MKNKKKIVLVSLIAIGVIILTAAVTYAFLSYRKEGLTENTMRVGDITFHYQEIEGMGQGISITDALPVDSNETARTAETPFNFRITSNSGGTVEIPYTVTARMSSDSASVMGDIVDLYLTEVDGNDEDPTALFTNGELKYNSQSLVQYSGINNYTEKVIYEGIADGNYSKNFRLRMWVDQNAKYHKQCIVNGTVDTTITEEANCTGTWDYPYNGKTFSITVNVYANGRILNDQEYTLKKSTNITSLSVGNETPTYNETTGVYELTTTNSEVEIDVTPENPNAKVQIVPTDSTYALNMNTGIRRITAINLFDLNVGDNYFKIIVTPVDKETNPKIYKLKITKQKSTDATLSSLSTSNCPLNETFDSETITYTCTTEDVNLNMNYTKSNSHSNVVVTGGSNLLPGDNTVTLAVTAEDGTTNKIYTITVTRLKEYTNVTGDSILKILKDNDLETGYYTFKINDKTEKYNVHLYVYEPESGNTITWNSTTIPMEKFGVEEDVSTTINGTRQYADAMVAVKVKGNLVNETTIQPYYNETTNYGGPKGFLLYVTGTLTNNGTIDNSHGAYAKGEDVWLWKNATGENPYEFVPATGADGGLPASGKKGKKGSDGTERKTGGGGSGGYNNGGGSSNNGAAGTSYSGGTGSYGNGGYAASTGLPDPNGGMGGWISTGQDYSAGGAGNPGGRGSIGSDKTGKNGTGGLLIIYADELLNSGNITAIGTTGGIANAGGGSSGGGSINIFTKGSTVVGARDKISAAGGAASGRIAASIGGAGGSGSVSTGSIATGTYVAN